MPTFEPYTNLEEARKNRERIEKDRIAEKQRKVSDKTSHNERPKVVSGQKKVEVIFLEDCEPGATRDEVLQLIEKVATSPKPIREKSNRKNERRGIAFPGHYKKVADKEEEIKMLFKSGNSIRKTSRDLKVAANTVRKVVREDKKQEDVRGLVSKIIQSDVSLIYDKYKQGVEERKKEWGSKYSESEIKMDSWIEVHAEMNDPERMADVVMEWINALPTKSEDNVFLRGVYYTLSNLRNYFLSLKNIEDEIEINDKKQ